MPFWTRSTRLNVIRAEWGTEINRDRNMKAIAAYARGVPRPGTPLDDRTWNDLNMDDIFAGVDRTQSVVGQQVLYSRLRSGASPEQLAAFEALITHATENVAFRERAQLALSKLRAPAAYDLWSLTQPDVFESAPWHALFPVAGLSMLALIVLAPFFPGAIFLLVLGSLGSVIARFMVAPSLRVVAGAFRQLGPLLKCAADLRDFPSDAASLVGTLQTDVPRLARLRRIASWAGRDSTAAVAGDLTSLLFEYLNMVLWLDANAVFFGARELRARSADLLRVIAAVGEVDAAISIASYRAGTPVWTRPVFKSSGPVVLDEIRHPLVPDAVPASITLLPPNGVIITGSNMSGKSTFLRTVGVNTVLAQTVNTCLARRYEAVPFVVRSCIGMADDPSTGKSYYLVEVESVVSLLNAARSGVPHLLLFDELFRGTNAVERIAAAEAVLASLVAADSIGPVRHIVIAATHDQELVDLLQGLYQPHHFTDAIGPDGLTFDYQLHPGPATTRNAIALLGHRGAPQEVVAHALERARKLDAARSVAVDR